MSLAPAETEVVLVTGTSQGIGRHLAAHYVERGMTVVGCSRSETDLSSPRYTHHRVDVSDEAEVKKLFDSVRRRHGRLDYLVNNAGMASMNSFVLTPLSKLRELIDVNLVGAFLVCREASKLMIPRGFGRIVNFTTIAVPLVLEGEAAYAATKSGVETMSAIMSRELAPYGITVNVVGPSAVETNLTRSVPKDKMDKVISRQAVPRFASPDEIANVTDFFLSRKSGMVTGQCLYLGGV